MYQLITIIILCLSNYAFANNDKLNNYPMPILASDKDDVFVGRIREDVNLKNVFHLWVVSDNLRKGAATNTVQIADYLIDNNLIF